MQTPERFRSLASTLTGSESLDGPDIVQQEEASSEGIPRNDPIEVSDNERELVREVRLFHARVIEAVEASVETLTADIAADVLARELCLAPADIEAIIDRALQRFAQEQPVRVRVHDADLAGLTCSVPLIADARLRPGDAVIELRSGSVDASLGVRLAAVLSGLQS